MRGSGDRRPVSDNMRVRLAVMTDQGGGFMNGKGAGDLAGELCINPAGGCSLSLAV